jgi:hypothetical protein
MRLSDHVTLNSNNYMPMVAVFLDIEKETLIELGI